MRWASVGGELVARGGGPGRRRERAPAGNGCAGSGGGSRGPGRSVVGAAAAADARAGERMEANRKLRLFRLNGGRDRRSCSSDGAGRRCRVGSSGSGWASARGSRPPEPANRYERARPGELVHVDVKKLGPLPRRRQRASPAIGAAASGRGRPPTPAAGARLGLRPRLRRRRDRLAYVEVLPDERGASAAFPSGPSPGSPSAASDVERVMSDGRTCYVSHKRARAVAALGLRHLRARPYRPRTNGEAERFVQTLQNDWARPRLRQLDRTHQHLPDWLTHFDYERPHGSLSHQPPAARLAELQRTT